MSELTTNRLSVYLRCLTTLEAGGRAERVVAGAGRAVPPERRADPQGPRPLRRVRRARRRLLRQGPAPAPPSDPRARSPRPGRRSWAPAISGWRSPTTPAFSGEGFEIAALFDTVREKVGRRSRSGVPIHDAREFKRIARREGIAIAVIAVPADVGAGGRQLGRRRRHAGDPELLTRDAERAARRQAEERRSDRVTREPVVLPGAARGWSSEREARRPPAAPCRAPTLSHVDAEGRIRMVDVSAKAVTAREAVARRTDPDVGGGARARCAPAR